MKGQGSAEGFVLCQLWGSELTANLTRDLRRSFLKSFAIAILEKKRFGGWIGPGFKIVRDDWWLRRLNLYNLGATLGFVQVDDSKKWQMLSNGYILLNKQFEIAKFQTNSSS